MLVVFEGFHAADQQAAGAVGAQADIDVVQHAGRGGAGEPGDDLARQARVQVGGVRVVVVVQKDYVQVRGVAQLLAAQFAVAHHGKLWRVAVALGDVQPGMAHGDIQHQVGQARQLVAKRFQRPHAGQVLRYQAEGLRVLEMAQCVHLCFYIAMALGQLLFQLCGQLWPVRRGVQHAGVQQLVQQNGVARQVVGHPGAGRVQRGQALQGLRVFQQQRQIGGAAADGIDQLQDALQRGVRVVEAGRYLHQRAHQGVQLFAAGVW